MLRRPALLLSVFPALLLIAACNEKPVTEALDVTRPVKTMLIGTAETGGMRSFPAYIDAHRRAEMAFRVPGKVSELLVKEGEEVVEGQEVAKLDPTDFQIVVNDRQATFDNASKNFERAKDLVKQDFISQKDYDQLEAEFKNSRAALNTARQDLEYTSLRVPFAGSIAKRHIEQFEEVRAKQPVLSLQDVTSLEVKFNIPESIIRGIRIDEDEQGKPRDRVRVFATFENLPGEEIPLSFKEVSTKADERTQTFEVTYTMQQLDRSMILPGMTAMVTVDLSQVKSELMVFAVPVSAVVGDYKLEPKVWMVDMESMTVRPKAVKVGHMLGSSIEVLDGLEPDNRIVIAGTPFMVDGMKVTLMPELEQAEPRPDDPKQ